MPEPTSGEAKDDPAAGVSGSLKRAIKDSGISLSELSRRTGVARQAINRFLSGERGLTTDTVDKLCHELGLALIPKRASGGPSSISVQPGPEVIPPRPKSSFPIYMLRCKYLLLQLNDKRPFPVGTIWNDLMNRTKQHPDLYGFIGEARAYGSDKQKAAVQCLVLSIMEMNPNGETLIANPYLPGFLRYLVTQEEDPFCLGSLGAVLEKSDIYEWFHSLPDPEPEPETDEMYG